MRHILCALTLLTASWLAADTQASPPSKLGLALRIDQDCRVWWNIGVATPDNLPKLLESASATEDSGGYFLDYDSLYTLFTNPLMKSGRAFALITPHPDAHYICVDNALGVMDWLERDHDRQTALTLGVEVTELSRERRYSFRYEIRQWEDGDTKIMQYIHKEAGLVRGAPIPIDDSVTVRVKLSEGHWNNRKVYKPPKQLPPWVGPRGYSIIGVYDLDSAPDLTNQPPPADLRRVPFDDASEPVGVEVMIDAHDRTREVRIAWSSQNPSLDSLAFGAMQDRPLKYFRKGGELVTRRILFYLQFPVD